jgi:peptidoglycan/xylan/chitin deacetylase (PgdA/CDA1 family)
MTALAIVIIALAALYLLWRVRLGTPPPRWPQVLCFHKISNAFCWEGTWTTPGRFFTIIDRLIDRGSRFVDVDEYLVSIDEIILRDEGGAASPLPLSDAADGRPLLLTFDDGYAEIYDLVLPGLESRGVPFHTFLVTDYIGRNNDWDLSLGRRPFRHLDWRQIEEMSRRGASFGSHGATHMDLTRMAPDDVREEFVRSKAAIEDRIGVSVRTVSYPFGRYNDTISDLARETGYEAGFSLYPSHHNTQLRRYAIRRNGVYIIDTPGFVETKLSSGPWFWIEELKCRAINGVAVLTPAFKHLLKTERDRSGPRRPDRGS